MLSVIIVYLLLFVIIEWIYIRIAEKKGIIDRLNERSSHTSVPIRGAGIIFPISFILPLAIGNECMANLPVLIGLILISFISFKDDIKSVLVKWRILFHFTAVSLVIWQIGLFNTNLFYVAAAFIFMVGIINAYNFMDGINGITAIYSLIAVGTLFFINQYQIKLIDEYVFVSVLAALLVFSFHNVRKVTKCFSGDVGSISIAFILTFLILKLIIATGNYLWIFLLAIYGIDTVGTIIIRAIRKEHLLQAHRSHFYQYLVNERRVSHVLVSSFYGLVQIVFNFVLITQKPFMAILLLIILIMCYVLARLLLEGPKRLFVKY